jgi:ketosteroid isomerase-like protein
MTGNLLAQKQAERLTHFCDQTGGEDQMTRTDDLVEIGQVAALYGHLIDAKQWDRLGEIYAEDGTYESQRGGAAEGLAAIRAYLSGNEQPVTHMISNVHVDLAEGADSATGVAKFFVVRADGDVLAGEYADRWARTPAGWRLAHRRSLVTAPAAVAAQYS